MNKKFAIVLALALIAIVCCAGCIDPQEPVDPVDPVVPVDPVDPVTPPVDPVVPAVEYSVFFMLNYDGAGAYSAETVTAGDAVAKPTNPTRSGYNFKGWFTAAEGGVAYDFTQAVNADLTLYAQWSKKSSSGGSSTPSHTHSYGDYVSNDDGTHTKSCNSGDSTVTEDCKFGGYICTLCGYESEVYHISNLTDLQNFATAVNGGDSFSGKTVELDADIDLGNVVWTPIGSESSKFAGTFDGNGKTISNMDAEGTKGVGFFGYAFPSATIKDLVVKNAVISGSDYLGGIVGSSYGSIINCSVENVTLIATPENGDGGAKVGGIVGYLGEGSYTVSGNTAKDVKITAFRDAGGIAGMAQYGTTVSDNTVDKLTIIIDQANNYYENNNQINAGDVVGRLGIDGSSTVTLSGNTATNVDIKYIVGSIAALNKVLSLGETEIYVTLANDITGDVTVEQKADVKITIDGNNNKFDGVITVDGKSKRYATAALTIKNVNFAITRTVGSSPNDAIIRLGHVDAARYTHGVTVKNCTFSGNGFVAVKSYTGGDYNLTIDGCTVNTGMHSLAQLKNVEKNLQIKNCIVSSKNGLNVNNGNNLYMINCTFDVQGYAVRFGSDDGVYDRVFNIIKSTLKSACAESGDAVIEFRSGAISSKLILEETVLEGTPKFKGATADTIIIIDGVRYSEYMYVDDNGEYCISTPEALFAFAKTVNEDKTSYSGKTVKLTADIDLENKAWTPIGNTGVKDFIGTFDGQGHTIYNLNVDSTGKTGNYASGLFGWTTAATIKNLNVDTAIVKGHQYVGVIAGYLQTIPSNTIENCHVINAEVYGIYNDDDACGKHVGVIVGFANNADTLVKKCTVTDSVVSSGRDAGQLVGTSKAAYVVECTATNVQVSATGMSTGDNIRNDLIGRLMV